jgi:hypothetical protein
MLKLCSTAGKVIHLGKSIGERHVDYVEQVYENQGMRPLPHSPPQSPLLYAMIECDLYVAN